MDIKIFDSILHGKLRPWKIDESDTTQFIDCIKSVPKTVPQTTHELFKTTKTLLNKQAGLLAITQPLNQPIKELSFQTVSPVYYNANTQYYLSLISNATTLYYNIFIEQAKQWEDAIDINFQTQKVLKSLIVLAKQTIEELNERSYTDVPDNKSDIVHFALFVLKQNLLTLHQSIQHELKEELQETVSLENLYLLELEIPFDDSISFVGKPLNQLSVQSKKTLKLSFGFNSFQKKEQLKSIVQQLCLRIDLLNEDISPVDKLLELLFAKDIKPGLIKIQLNTDNIRFRYTIEKLQPYFDSLSFINIERTESFFSKGGTLLNANDMSKAKKSKPKQQQEIDKIFKEVQ